MNSSYQEKVMWFSGLAILFIYGDYFVHIFALPITTIDAVGLFWRAVIAIIVVQFIFHVALPVFKQKLEQDKRDSLIRTKFTRNSYYVLTVCCLD